MNNKSATNKIYQKKKNNKNNKLTCCVCGLPGIVQYEERDEETGKTVTKEHYVPCLGHSYLKAPVWNMHKDHDAWRMFDLQRKAKNQKEEKNA